jgi:endo-1,4-beta-xylanase
MKLNRTLLLLLSSVFLFVSSVKAQTQPIRITLWHIATESDPFRPVLQGAIDQFNATHTDIQFEAQAIQNELFKDQLQAAVLTGQQPDVFQTWGGGLLQIYADAGLVREIPEISSSPFAPNALSPSTFDGRHYAVPANLAGVFLWYNQDLFNQHGIGLPATWDELLNACRAFQQVGIVPVAVGNRDQWPGALWLTYLAARLGGTDALSENSLASAGDYLQEAVQAGCFGRDVNSTGYGEAQTLLANGSAAMQLQGDWNLGGLRSVNTALTDASIRVLPFPAVTGTTDASIVGGTGQAFAISSDAPPETAQALIELFSGDAYGRSVAEAGFIPALTGYETAITNALVREMATWLLSAPRMQLYLDQALMPDAAEVHLQTTQQLFEGSIMPTQAAAAVWAAALQPQLASLQVPDSLKELAQQYGIQIGTAVLAGPLRNEPAYSETIKREFNLLTPETAMKMSVLRPTRETFDFAEADFILDFAQANGMQVRGHPLVWHNQLPQWLEQGTFTRDEFIQILEQHIRVLVGRYRGRIPAWDVVNEAFNDDGTLRDTIWLRGIGPEYIEYAFQWAHEADPEAMLFYNDYNSEGLDAKSEAIYRMVSDLKARGVPIHGVGLQMHVNLNEPPSFESVMANMQRLGDLGMDVEITEMDVRTWDNNASTSEKLSRQAELYGNMMRACLLSTSCSAFITWGFTDQYTWITDSSGVPDMALLFDPNYQPKPAYFALVNALIDQPVTNGH